MFRFIKKSISLKVTFLITSFVMLTVVAVGLIFYFGVYDFIKKNELHKIEKHKVLINRQFNKSFRELLSQAKFIEKYYLKNDDTSFSKLNLILEDYNFPVLSIEENLKGKFRLKWKNNKIKENIINTMPSHLESDLYTKLDENILIGNISYKNINNQLVKPLQPIIPIIINIKNNKKLKILFDIKNLFVNINLLIPEEIKLFMFKENGIYITHPNTYKVVSGGMSLGYNAKKDLPFFNSITESINFDNTFQYKEKTYLASSTYFRPYLDIDRKYGLLLILPKQNIFNSLKIFRHKSNLLSLVLIILTTIIGWFFTRHIFNYLDEIILLTRRYTQGETDLTFKVSGTDEISTLAQTFQDMIEKVNERTRILRKSERTIREARDQAEQALSSKSQLLEDIRLQKTEIERFSKEKDDLLAIVSHDLKNPLAVIETSMDILLDDTGPNDPSMTHDLIRRSKSSAQMALNLITDLLDLARLEGGIKLDFEKFNFIELLRNVKDSFYLKSKEKNININIKAASEFHIYADYGRCIQVINNVVGNSLKFTPQNGEINITIKLTDYNKKIDGSSSALYIQIEDNGPGIPEDKLSNIFNKFEQAREKDREIGTGLGLAISKNICQLHNGEIWAENNPNGGAKFIFILPRAVENINEKNLENTEDENEELEENFGKTILLVDDDFAFRAILINKLSEEKFNILEAENGEVAMTIIESHKPDLIFLDTDMPVKNGRETLKELKSNQIYKDIPLIMMSNSFEQFELVDISVDIDDILIKENAEQEIILKTKFSLGSNNLTSLNRNLDPELRTILIIDDEEGIRIILSERFESEPYNILTAKNGIEGLFYIKKYNINLVLSDIRMQELDGLTLSKIIRKDYSHIPIILMSANLVMNSEDLITKFGVLEVILKPFNIESVVESINNYFTSTSNHSIAQNIDNNIIELKQDNTQLEGIKKQELVASSTIPTNKLLLIDDSEDMQMIFTILLKKTGYDITIKSNGQEGLEAFKNGQFDAVFMDINMPIMKGDEAILLMRDYEKEQNIPHQLIFVMTANDTQEDIKRYLGLGFDSFIKKPLNKDKIISLIPKKAA